MPTFARDPDVFGAISTFFEAVGCGVGFAVGVSGLASIMVTLIFWPGFKLFIATAALFEESFGVISSALVGVGVGFADGVGVGFRDGFTVGEGVGLADGFTVGEGVGVGVGFTV